MQSYIYVVLRGWMKSAAGRYAASGHGVEIFNAAYLRARAPLYLKLPVARYCMLPSTCLVLTVVCTMETYEKECCVRGYLPTCDLAANAYAVNM